MWNWFKAGKTKVPVRIDGPESQPIPPNKVKPSGGLFGRRMKNQILSAVPTKGSDLLISWGTAEGTFKQYIRRGASYFCAITFEEVPLSLWSEIHNAYQTYLVKQDYLDASPLVIAIKSKKSEVKCIYCKESLSKKAQVCLDCGGFICLACSPELEKCPTLGCV